MIHSEKNKQIRRMVTVAALAGLTNVSIAYAQMPGTYTGLPPLPGTNEGLGTRTNVPLKNTTAGIQSVLSRAKQLQQAAIGRSNIAPEAARVSYGAASQAFGDLLRSLGATGTTSGVNSQQRSGEILSISSEQATSDVRLLKVASKQAKTVAESNRLRKAASLYATGIKEFLTAQLREALLETSLNPTIVLRGNAQEANAANNPLPQPIPNPVPAPAPNPAPAPVPNPMPAPNPGPVPNPVPEPNPVPNPNGPPPNPVPPPNLPPR